VMVGQKIVVKNSDAFLHNVHPFATENTVNGFSQPNKDPGKDIGAMKKVETFRVKCDVHPWMSMYVSVMKHPFFAVSAADGSFKLPPLPAGTHTLTFWHEKYGAQEKEVVVEPGKTLDVKFTFQQN
jgi:hypothetical protein